MHEEAKKYLASIGSKGGKAGRGKSKARTRAQARNAARARWAKAKAGANPNLGNGQCLETVSRNETLPACQDLQIPCKHGSATLARG